MATEKRIRAVPSRAIAETSFALIPIADASARLGITESAIRRRLRLGTMSGEQQATPQGHKWFVRLDALTADPAEASDAEAPVVRSRRRAVAMPTPAIDLEAVRADHLAELARLAEAHAGEVGALRNAIAVLRAEHADAFARLEAAHGQTLEVLKASHAGEVEVLRRELTIAKAWANRSWWRWLFGLPPA